MVSELRVSGLRRSRKQHIEQVTHVVLRLGDGELQSC